MATPARAYFDQAGLSGAFNKSKFNDQFFSTHQGDFEALRPRAQAAPNMTLAVQAATVQSFYRQVYFNNAQSTFSGGNSPTFTAPVSNPRLDLLYLSDTGVLTVLQGTEAVSPVSPTYPDLSKNFPICEVFLRVGMTSIVNFEDSGANPTQGYIYRDVRPWFWSGGVSAHGSLTGLTGTDHHTQYALLAGRALGQTLQGGTAASEKLTLESTAHATKGSVRVKDALELDDKAADPATAGYFQRNGASLRFHDGTAARDVLMSNKAAGGDLSGTYPNPTVSKVNGVTALPIISVNQAETSSPVNVGTGWTDILTLNVTPNSTNSTFLIYASASAACQSAGCGSSGEWGLRITRDGSQIHVLTSDEGGAEGRSSMHGFCLVIRDAPGTTSQVTYKIQAIAGNSGVFAVPGNTTQIGVQSKAVLTALEFKV